MSAHAATPYAAALLAHAHRDTLNLMVPGHGATSEGSAAGLADAFGAAALAMDIPPLVDGIDVGGESPLVHAQRLAAEAWGVRRTWFLTNGASQANRMAALAVAGLHRGAHVLAQRSAHSSFTDGVIIADLVPAPLFPSVDTRLGIHHGVTPSDVARGLEAAMASGRRVAAVCITSPSYFGAVADVAGIAGIAHRAGVPLIVDGAWGAHFGFHDRFPASPTRQGADLVVSSTHKLGGSLTQSAMLHLGHGSFADALGPLLDRAAMLTSSTSASALLLGSLDIARQTLVDGEGFSRSIEAMEEFRARVRRSERYSVVSDGFGAFDDIVDHDPMRVSIDVSKTGLTGHDVRHRLARDHGIYLEISTAHAIVAFVGPGKHPDLDRFGDALESIAREAAHHAVGLAHSAPIPPVPQPGPMVIHPREAYFRAHEVVSAIDAVGRISADALAAYPPGIPNVVPGEQITAETIAFLQAVAASPIGYVRGALDARLDSFRVV